MSAPVPYTWKVGVDNAFGYLTRSDGTHLAESRRFLSGSGLAVRLTDGGALLTVADGSSSWQPLTPERACELADIPEPAVDGVAEAARRLDPFHVERHTSPLFLIIVDLAVRRRLPCAHALRAWLAGTWDGTFDGAYLEQPETFAASVLERIAGSGQEPPAGVLSQIGADAALTCDRPPVRIAQETGWTDALAALPTRITTLADVITQARSTRRARASADQPQLSLL